MVGCDGASCLGARLRYYNTSYLHMLKTIL